jgi:hypothetical protein
LLVKIAFTTNLMVGDGKFPDVAQNLMTQPMCVYIYIYIHTHTHARIHTYIEREDLKYISISSFVQMESYHEGGNSN